MVLPFVVVGAGVVGLHVALALSEAGDVVVLEREAHLGAWASGRNSQILHAGLSYTRGSLKARLCVEGNRLSYAWLARHGVPHARTGKWIVARSADEVPALERLAAAARDNGVTELTPASPAELARAEPGCRAFVAALASPSTGVVDAAAYLAALARALHARGGHVLTQAEVVAIDPARRIVTTRDRGELAYGRLVNCAGLDAADVYRMCGGTRDLTVRAVKGEYYTWRTAAVRTAIYPVPARFLAGGADPARASSLGVHVHRDLAGALWVGPTEVPLAPGARDHALVTAREVFAAHADTFAPLASLDDLTPGYAGLRAKVAEAGRTSSDFLIFGEGRHVHLLGVESPGLTAAPAIARHVAALVDA